MLWAFIHEEEGATAIEYALISSLILLAILTALVAVGGSNGGGWVNTATEINTAMSGN